MRGSQSPHAAVVQCARPAIADVAGGQEALASISSNPGIIALPTGTTTEPLKIMQSESKWAMLVTLGDTYVTLHGEALCPLQVLDSNSSPCISESQRRLATFSPAVGAFGSRTRLSCTDSAAANFEAEAGVAANRDPRWSLCHSVCMIHRGATMHKKALMDLDLGVTSVVWPLWPWPCAMPQRTVASRSPFER